MDSYNSPTTKSLFKGTQIVWYIASILAIVLIFRFVLKLTAANPAAGFTNFIYSVSRPFTAPFSAVFPRSIVEGSIFEWTTLLAIAVYWMIAIAIVQLFLMSKTVSIPEAASALEDQE